MRVEYSGMAIEKGRVRDEGLGAPRVIWKMAKRKKICSFRHSVFNSATTSLNSTLQKVQFYGPHTFHTFLYTYRFAQGSGPPSPASFQGAERLS
jgi:hypothetical protein